MLKHIILIIEILTIFQVFSEGKSKSQLNLNSFMIKFIK